MWLIWKETFHANRFYGVFVRLWRKTDFSSVHVVSLSCWYCCAAGGKGVVWSHGERKKTERWEVRLEKAIKAYLSQGIFMTSSYEELGVSVVSYFDSFNFNISTCFCLLDCFLFAFHFLSYFLSLYPSLQSLHPLILPSSHSFNKLSLI